MGPLAHAVATKVLVDQSPGWGLWPDIPVVFRWRYGAELTHGWPGGLAAFVLGGRRALMSWAVHVALDSVSHEPGEGAWGKGPRLWLP